MMTLHFVDYIVFGLLLFLSAMAGPYYMWRDRNKPATSESYFMGNRELHVVPTAASLFASIWSAIAIVAVPAELYTAGAKYVMAGLGQAMGPVIAAFIVVPMLYKLKLISCYGYFEMRFQSRLLRKIGAVTNFLAHAFHLAAVTFAPCIALAAVSPIPVWASVTASAAIAMFYTVLGGVKAVVLVDFIQTIVMFGGIVVAIVIGYMNIEGGIYRAMDISREMGRLDFFDFNLDLRTYNFWVLAIPTLFAASGGMYSTSQAAVQRYSALPSVRQASWSMMSLGLLIVILYTLLFFLANAMFAHYDAQGCDPLRGGIISSPNQLTTFYVAEILNYPGLVGIWFSALFSGSLSTMSTGYNSVAACIWEDLLKEKLEKLLSPRGISNVLKLISLMLGIFSCLIALAFQLVQGNVMRLINWTANTFWTTIFIAFFCGSMFPFANARGCIVGMAIASSVSFFLAGGQMYYNLGNQQVWLPTKTSNCSAMLANLIASGKYRATPEQLRKFGINASKAVTTSLMLLTASPAAGLHTNIPNSTLLIFPPSMPSLVVNDTLLRYDSAQLPEIPTPNANEISSDADALPKPLLYMFSMCYFMFPFITLIVGVVLAVVVSLSTGGWQSAKTIHPRFMVVKNCFYKVKNVVEEKKTDIGHLLMELKHIDDMEDETRDVGVKML